jgi:FAD/FMN-containing dehydrogenase
MTNQKSAGVSSTTVLERAVVESFRATLRGRLLEPDDAGYDEARKVWNGMIDRRPALIARCAGVSDVIRSIEFARTHGLLVSVRGGGHSFAGTSVCDDGLMIDLSLMRGIRVDQERHTARAEAGALWSDLDHETQMFGLATTGGTVSHTGIGGLSLGGGQGWLMGMHGLTCDNVLSVDVVTADGRLLTASERQNADLFWAVRGGGGNFGVATSFEYQLHHVGPMVLGGMVLHPIAHARDVLRFYADFSRNTPEELMTLAALLTLPDGTPAVALVVGWFGDRQDGDRRLKPLRDFGTPIADMIGEIPYRQLQTTFDAAVPHGMPRYLKMGYVPELRDALVDVIVDQMARNTSPFSVCLLNVIKGAVCRVPPDATAFWHRGASWHLDIVAQWTDSAAAEQHIGWVREFWKHAEPFTQGASVNFLGADDGAARVKASYGGNYARLVALKQQYDPANFFRMNTNIVPATQVAALDPLDRG